jgi:molybdopterin molybdotransferase
MSRLTHVGDDGRAHMVDVSEKTETARTAVAGGYLICLPATLAAVREGNAPKGSVIGTAEVAGIMAAKRTSELIPLCHPLLLTDAVVTIEVDDDLPGFRVSAQVRAVGSTGVEMEALTAVSIACRHSGDREGRREIGELVARMIPFDEALRRVQEAARPIGRERVVLAEASNRVLAEPVCAMVDSPPVDSSAMDGYAVRDADLPGTLRLIGQSFAGSDCTPAVVPGTCVRIFTGAPVPDGADRVVIQELVARDGDLAIFAQPDGGARHIRPRGSDFRIGDILLEPGRRLDPRALVAAAGADIGDVEAWRRPTLVVLGTGDELAPPGEARLRPGAIPESVSFGVAAMAEAWGARSLGSRRLADDLEVMELAAGEALAQADLVVVTGGASVGEKDFAKAMFEAHGLDLFFAKVAIKPGKPVWFGRAGGRLVLGLPGNPTSAMVTARLLLAPLVAGLSGHDGALDWRPLPLAATLPACGERETFHRARRTDAGAVPLSNQDSSAQRLLAQADLLLRSRPHDPEREIGETVEALAF